MSFGAPADEVPVSPAARAAGRVRVPGDKSISHRYALLAALADGDSGIAGYSRGADCAATLACLRGLGVPIDASAGALRVRGLGLGGLRAPARPLDAMNSGTTLRLLAGILAAHPFESTIGGDASLSRRPMRRVVDPLTRMGAQIESREGYPPLHIHGAALHAIAHRPEVPSAQVKSAVLLAGLHANGATRVEEPAPTRDHTERALKAFGVHVDCPRPGVVMVEGGQRLTARELTVPGDVSAAIFWAALAAGTPGGEITIDEVGLNPTRTAVFDVLRRSGAVVEATPRAETAGEPVGRIRVAWSSPRSFEVTPAEVPAMIDELPALAALAAMQPGGCRFVVRGASELRVKESDRIAALAAGLRALGASVEEFGDGFAIEARPLAGGVADSHGDHRLVMAFAVAATRASGPSVVLRASAADVSYPGFFADLRRLTSSGDGR